MKCLTCDREFTRKSDGRRRPKYCSSLCYRRRKKTAPRNLRLRDLLAERPVYCVTCGGEFIRLRTTQICCSKACSQRRSDDLTGLVSRALRRLNALKPRRCEFCDGIYTPRQHNQLYCCQRCANAGMQRQCRARRKATGGQP